MSAPLKTSKPKKLLKRDTKEDNPSYDRAAVEDIRIIKAQLNAIRKEYERLDDVCKYWSISSKTAACMVTHQRYVGCNYSAPSLTFSYFSPHISPDTSPLPHISPDTFRNPMATVSRVEHPRVFAEHAIEIFKEAAIVQRYRAMQTEPLHKEQYSVKRSDYEVLARSKQLDEYVMGLVSNDQANEAWNALRTLCVEIGECVANDIFTRRFSQCTCQKRKPESADRPKVTGVACLPWAPDTNGCEYYHGTFKPPARARSPPSLETVIAAAAEMFAAMPRTFGSLPASDDASPTPATPPDIDRIDVAAAALRSMELCWDDECT